MTDIDALARDMRVKAEAATAATVGNQWMEAVAGKTLRFWNDRAGDRDRILVHVAAACPANILALLDHKAAQDETIVEQALANVALARRLAETELVVNSLRAASAAAGVHLNAQQDRSDASSGGEVRPLLEGSGR